MQPDRSSPFEPTVTTPEDAARRYDFYSPSDWSDLPIELPTEGWRTASLVISIIAFALFSFFVGSVIAAVWETIDEAPARGVMDGSR